MSSAKLTKDEAKQLLASVINYPVFVPELGHQLTHALVAGELKIFHAELERLSNLGSRPASALLVYLHMKGAFDAVADLGRVETLCVEAARSGDPYSQYVMGWICRAAGRDVEAVDWLKKAAAKGVFLPAIVDIARFMVGGIGVVAPDRGAALAILWDAHKLGHRMALVYIAELWKSSSNWIRKVLGFGLYPVAVMRATRFADRHPLSDCVFVTSLTTKRPLFKVQSSAQPNS